MTRQDPEVLVTVDLEERYHGLRSVPEANYDGYASLLGETTPQLLELFDRASARATFFVLGAVADSHPEVVKEIETRGHEIASHADSHRFMCDLNEEEFRNEVSSSKTKLESITGDAVAGFRAPYFSLTTDEIPEYFRILHEEGYRYDASLNPSSVSFFADHDAPRQPTEIESIRELPMSTIGIDGWRWPVIGGFTLRLLPLSIQKKAIDATLRLSSHPVVLYFHPMAFEAVDWDLWWECTFREKITHFYGRSEFQNNLNVILSRYRTASVQEYLQVGVNH